MRPFELTNAATVNEAVSQLAPGIVIKAGGVDLLDLMKDGLIAPRRLVNLRTVPGLDQVREGKDELLVGPLVTLAQLAADALVQKRYPALAEACTHAATPQIRNLATIGGNLAQRPRCWYFRSTAHHCKKKGGDLCFAQAGENQLHAIFANGTCAVVHPSSPATALVAYRARVTLTGGHGERTVELEKFFTLPDKDPTRENVLAPDEIITQISLPATTAGTRAAYHKQVEKESFDWPMADVAVVLELDGKRCKKASIVLGAAAPVPWRAAAAEAVLAGRTVDERAAEAAANAALEGARPLDKNRYKIPVFKAVVRRMILAAAGGAA
jgi:xanthine dehydrogenase YagS FAD-binding subunit